MQSTRDQNTVEIALIFGMYKSRYLSISSKFSVKIQRK